jgi:hypothetical protein
VNTTYLISPIFVSPFLFSSIIDWKIFNNAI